MVKKKVKETEKIPENDTPLEIKDRYIMNIDVEEQVREYFLGKVPKDNPIIIYTDNIYDSIGLSKAERDHLSTEKIHRLVSIGFNNQRSFYTAGINNHILGEYGLDKNSSIDTVLNRMDSIFKNFNGLAWVKRIWIYFWMCTIGYNQLIQLLYQYFKVNNHSDLMISLSHEIHPPQDRYLAIYIFYQFMLGPPRNDKFLTGSSMMYLYHLTMRVLSASEIDSEEEDILIRMRNMKDLGLTEEQIKEMEGRLDVLRQEK